MSRKSASSPAFMAPLTEVPQTPARDDKTRAGFRSVFTQFSGTRGLTSFVVTSCMLIVLGQGYRIWQDRANDLRVEEVATRNLSATIAQQTESAITVAAASIFGLAERVSVDGSGPDSVKRLQALLTARIASFQQIINIIVVDARGNLIVDGRGTLKGSFNYADRPDFQFHRKDSSRAIHISAPVKSRTVSEWILPVSYRVNNPDGTFGGVIVAVLPLAYFSALFDALDLGKKGAALLALTDGTVILRRPFSDADPGQDISNAPLFRDFLPKARQGTVDYNLRSDGITRILSYQQIDTYPIVVGVTLSKEEVLAGWWVNTRLNGAITIMILVLIGGAGIALARQYDERTRMEAEAMAAAAAYRLLADNSTDMIVQTDMNAIQRFVSPASEAILGFRPEELVGQPTGPNIHKDDIDFIDRVKSEILAGAVEARAVYRCYKRDGRIIWLEANIRPFRNAAGALEGTVAVIRDISAQKMIEGELRLGQSRLRQALDAADLGTWEREGDNQYRLDSMAQKYFDVSEDIVEGDVLISRADPKDKDLIRARLAELQTGSESEYKFLVDAKYFDRSGNSRHLEISAHLAFAGTGTDRRQISGFGTVRDITERKAAEAVVSELAFRDPLTGLPNRRLLLDRLEHFRAAFERRLRWGALIFVDLDKFKLLNDTYGHHRGDQLLKQVALRIQTCVRESDTVSRFGGDEFVILAEDIGGSFEEAEAKARVIGEKILREFEAPFLLDDHDYKSTPSIGISVIGDQGLSVDELLGQADAAMYQAKAAGRNTMRFFKFS